MKITPEQLAELHRNGYHATEICDGLDCGVVITERWIGDKGIYHSRLCLQENEFKFRDKWYRKAKEPDPEPEPSYLKKKKADEDPEPEPSYLKNREPEPEPEPDPEPEPKPKPKLKKQFRFSFDRKLR